MPPQIGPGQELEFGMTPGRMKDNVNLNVNMGSNSQMIPQNMRVFVTHPEEMMKLFPGRSNMLPAQQKILSLPFGEHQEQEYGMCPCHSFPCLRVLPSTVTCGISEN
jgi:hypothetical protein